MTNQEARAAVDAGDYDAVLADEIREYPQMDDATLAGLGLTRDKLEYQLHQLGG